MPTPKPDTVAQLFAEVVQQVESLVGRTEAVEKSVDEMRRKLEDSNKSAERAADALDRIAKIEDDRKLLEQRVAEQRWAIFDKLWNNSWVQMLVGVIVLGLINLLGLSYLVPREAPLPAPLAPSAPAPIEGPDAPEEAAPGG